MLKNKNKHFGGKARWPCLTPLLPAFWSPIPSLHITLSHFGGMMGGRGDGSWCVVVLCFCCCFLPDCSDTGWPTAAVPLGSHILLSLVSSPCSHCSFASAVLLLYCLLYLSVLFLACASISPVLVSALASPLFSRSPPLASPFSILVCVSSSGFYLPFLSILLQRHQGLLWFHFGTLWVC